MSSEESGEDQCEDEKQSDLSFLAVKLVDFPEALEKSQQPELKKKKDAALLSLVHLYEGNFGKPITIKSLLKKINNMKTRLKKKTDKNETGNKEMKLSKWEKTLFKVMDGGSNPTLQQIPGKLYSQVTIISQFEDLQTFLQELHLLESPSIPEKEIEQTQTQI